MSNKNQSPASSNDNNSTSAKRIEALENSSLAQGNEIDDSAELGADNDADVIATSQNNVTIETATKAADKRIVVGDNKDVVLDDDDTKRASGNRSNSEFRQSDQHGNMTRPDDRRQGKGGSANSHFVKH